MKIVVKTLKGTNFEIEVKPEDTVVDVKKCIESVRGAQAYPAARQMLIHQGKFLEDATTLEENAVVENNFVVVMLSKATETSALPTSTVASPPPPTTATIEIPSDSELYLEGLIKQLLDMGGGTWDRDTVVLALGAAFNNPERAIEYLYTGIPENAIIPSASGSVANPPLQPPSEEEAAATTSVVVLPSSGPNTTPLDLFPQGLPGMGSNAAGSGSLDFLRNNPQFQGLRGMVQTNPQFLQPLLQELEKQNPDMMRKIQENEAEFLRLINDPVEGEGGNLENDPQLDDAMETDANIEVLTVTPEEREAIERLQGMGFDPTLVLEVYFLCNKNEELAANYLLDHMNQD